jgi:hypothetical protein
MTSAIKHFEHFEEDKKAGGQWGNVHCLTAPLTH